MGDDNKNKPPRRGLPGGFLLIILAVVLIFYSFQSMNKDKAGKVSFSHQVEHLVNLDLLHKDSTKKIALNDNLVTFSGKFNDRVTDNAKARYRFLELLNTNNQLTLEQASLEKNLQNYRSGVERSADWFLNLSGISIPSRGYVVVNSSYDMPGSDNAVVIRSVTDRQIMSLKEIKSNFRVASSTPAQLDRYGSELRTLVQSFRSPNLGIGNEAMKQQLKDMDEAVFNARDYNLPERTEVYASSVNQLQGIVDELNQPEDGVRLGQLRSVRTYKQDLIRYRQISEELLTNSAQLDNARGQVA
ncbi:MAG: hypothetical protein KR126chlam3_01018, partial [Chlamydiae bacterium]|nr:hypothetical protein [Chlamydiota bacterium]